MEGFLKRLTQRGATIYSNHRMNYGMLLYKRRALEAAVAEFRHVIEHSEQVSDELVSKGMIAEIRFRQGHLDEAERFAQEAVAGFEDNELWLQLIIYLGLLSEIAIQMGQPSLRRRYEDRLRDISEKLPFQGLTQCLLAENRVHSGEWEGLDEALHTLRECMVREHLEVLLPVVNAMQMNIAAHRDDAELWERSVAALRDACARGYLLDPREVNLIRHSQRRTSNGVFHEDVRRLLRSPDAVSYTHLRAHETVLELVCRLLLEKKK